MKINFVNPEHVHALIDLPTKYSIEQVMQLLKGASSHWVNESNLVPGKFGWGRGYGVFSISQSNVAQVARYIAKQEEHHKKKSFQEEYHAFVRKHGLVWRDDETVKTVSSSLLRPNTSLKRGVNEISGLEP